MSGIAGDRDRGLAPNARLAAGLWFAAGLLYLGVEGLAAYAFTPAYSYACNYISDLGVPGCGITFGGRQICSPLHGLMNADFCLQGLLFLAAAFASARPLKTPVRFAFVAFAALNGLGNILVGLFPETSPAGLGGLPAHIAGAFLAIVFGNAAALTSAWTFDEYSLPRIHRWLSVALPLVAAFALTMLFVRVHLLRDGVWERMSVYTITAWELSSAVCIAAASKGRLRV